VLADTMTSLVTHLMTLEIEAQSMHTHRPPYCFFSMVSPDEENKRKGLLHAKELFEACDHATIAARTDLHVERHLQACMWPYSGWEKEMLVALLECGFVSVPRDIDKELLDISRGMVDTRANECLNGHIQNQCQVNSGHRIGRKSKWHRSITSGIMEDIDRKQVVVTATAKVLSKDTKLTDSDFSGKKCSFSFGKRRLLRRSRTRSSRCRLWQGIGLAERRPLSYSTSKRITRSSCIRTLRCFAHPAL
jgi:hypothetical protein